MTVCPQHTSVHGEAHERLSIEAGCDARGRARDLQICQHGPPPQPVHGETWFSRQVRRTETRIVRSPCLGDESALAGPGWPEAVGIAGYMGQRSLVAPVVLKPVGTNEYCRGQWLLGPGKGRPWKHIPVPAWPSMYFGGCLELERAETVIRPSWTMNSIQPHR